jgi:hypothetical protein
MRALVQVCMEATFPPPFECPWKPVIRVRNNLTRMIVATSMKRDPSYYIQLSSFNYGGTVLYLSFYVEAE